MKKKIRGEGRVAFRWSAVVLLCGIIFAQWCVDAAAQEWHPVKWVADGDTIFLQDGRHIRLIGINAPEVSHDDRPAEPFGNAARKALKKLVDHRKVRLEWDETKRDHYGRTLAHVFDQNNELVSCTMLTKGLAHLLYHKNAPRYFSKLLQSQQNAMAQKAGFWRSFQNKTGYDHFVGNRRSLRFHTPNCPEGLKIYRKNRVQLTDAWNAFQQGYAPAKGCLGSIGAFLK